MKKIYLICLACILCLVIFALSSCDELQNDISSIEKSQDFEKGEEIYNITLSNGTTEKIEVENEIDISIKEAEIDDIGNLILIMSDDTVKNLGTVFGGQGAKGDKGNKGDKGQQGLAGNAGNSIDRIIINNYDLIIYYTNGTTEVVRNAYEKDDWTLLYEEFNDKYNGYFEDETEFFLNIVANLLFTTEYTVEFRVMGVDVNLPEQTVARGDKVKEVEAPTISGMEFLGWYVGEEKWSFIGCVVTEDIILDAKYRQTTCDEAPDGKHSCKIEETEPNCIKAGSKTEICELCGWSSTDMLYPTLHPALGHKWTEDTEGEAWSGTAFEKTRQCLRENCGKIETLVAENVTASGDLSVIAKDGMWPSIADSQSRLTDGVWDADPIAPKPTNEKLVIEIDFGNTPFDVDFIAFSALNINGVQNNSYRVEILHEGDTEATLISSGFLDENNSKEKAIIIDLGDNSSNIVKVQITFENLENSPYIYELMLGKYELQ